MSIKSMKSNADCLRPVQTRENFDEIDLHSFRVMAMYRPV